MNELNYAFRENNVRVVMQNNEPWFVAKDVCEILEIKNPSDSLRRLDSDEKGTVLIDTPGGKQNVLSVNEYGLYVLVLGSRKAEAKEFKRWVTHEVIPSIRKTGGYVASDDLFIETYLPGADEQTKLMFRTTLQTVRKKNEEIKIEQQKRIEAENKNGILMHVNKTYTATEIAKELGFTSAKSLNADLNKKGIQFNQNGTWVLYSKYADCGYVNIKQDVLDNGKVIYHRKFTQLGRDFLLNLYKKEAI